MNHAFLGGLGNGGLGRLELSQSVGRILRYGGTSRLGDILNPGFDHPVPQPPFLALTGAFDGRLVIGHGKTLLSTDLDHSIDRYRLLKRELILQSAAVCQEKQVEASPPIDAWWFFILYRFCSYPVIGFIDPVTGTRTDCQPETMDAIAATGTWK
jgi:hypothetical protein